MNANEIMEVVELADSVETVETVETKPVHIGKVSDELFSKNLKAWGKSAKAMRDSSALLTIHALQSLADGNVQRLNALLTEIVGNRSLNTTAFIDFVLFHTGGGMMDNGKIVKRPEQSALTYSTKDVCFTIKKTPAVEKKDGMTKEQVKDARAVLAKKHQAKLTAAATKAGKGEWWLFAAATPASPYKINSLVSAIKKAVAEQGNLSSKDRAAIQAIADAAIKAGLEIA